ncbi:hypothetical protein A8M32_05995 [Sinorhizobium alkalisoli]|uniref:Uncharacterized protein n=1 Tax=Sinorhizobium alkalisoli TaxID=1752398 RepID=A0A1E3VF35_9HYPH|nr:hypothetical protein A8M32_05995 [Sinorhizobium alkalisoli]
MLLARQLVRSDHRYPADIGGRLDQFRVSDPGWLQHPVALLELPRKRLGIVVDTGLGTAALRGRARIFREG